MKYAFVERNRRQYGVPALCEALRVSLSGYYAARQSGRTLQGAASQPLVGGAQFPLGVRWLDFQ